MKTYRTPKENREIEKEFRLFLGKKIYWYEKYRTENKNNFRSKITFSENIDSMQWITSLLSASFPWSNTIQKADFWITQNCRWEHICFKKGWD